MIKPIETSKFMEAMGVLKIQAPAYRVEGEMIGFFGIPAMKETVESILKSKDTYLGYYENNALVGFIAYNQKDGVVDITKLVVNPPFFRRGIATKLLNHLFEETADATKYIVSTGTKNAPAVAFYKKFGFVEVGTTVVNPPNVTTTQFEKVK